ncbi:hypothetical protein M5D96_007706 [Drosophila gunungcola]|uniref:Uncharacterized protein n=1 Tax=Drosophila gunungcola TaxID=103775 RepID=A0A9P9YL95_9MUSC|nr:hypothetical protein M5D96_007706 [Drosophila gunungcola]
MIFAVIIVKLNMPGWATLRMRNLQQPEDHENVNENDFQSICHVDRTRGHELLPKLI